MKELELTASEIKDLCEHFPCSSMKPTVYQEEVERGREGVKEYIIVDGVQGKRHLPIETLIDLHQHGFLDVEFRLVCTESIAKMELRWESLLKTVKTVILCPPGTEFLFNEEHHPIVHEVKTLKRHNTPQVFSWREIPPVSATDGLPEYVNITVDSKDILPPKDITALEWKQLKERVHDNLRRLLVNEKIIAKNMPTALDHQYPAPDSWDEKRCCKVITPYDWQPFTGWDTITPEKDENGVLLYQIERVEWRIGRTKDYNTLIEGLHDKPDTGNENSNAKPSDEYRFFSKDETFADAKHRRLIMFKAGYSYKRIGDLEQEYFADRKASPNFIQLKNREVSTALDAIRKSITKLRPEPKSM